MTDALSGIHLCRHGQTDWNAEGRIQGQRDIPLNALGRAQAKRNGRYLRNVLGAAAGERRFLASPLGRTRETMRLIRLELGLEPDDYDVDPRLMELHFGEWQGATLKEVARRDPASVKERRADKWNYVPPGASAESYEVLAARAAPCFEALAGPSIVVAHGGISRIFLQRYCGMAREQAAHVSIPQDRILTLVDGKAAWV